MNVREAFTATLRGLREADLILLMLLAPLFYAFYYPAPYAGQHANDVPLAVVDEENSPLSRELVARIDAEDFAEVAAQPASLAEARHLLLERAVEGILVIPRRFEADALRGTGPGLAVWVNGAYLSRAGSLGTAIQNAAIAMLSQRASSVTGKSLTVPIVAQPLFNPSLGYGSYIFPAVSPTILQQTLLFGAAVMLARRRRRAEKSMGGREVMGTWLALSAVSAFVILFYLGWAFAIQDVPRQASAPLLGAIAILSGCAIASFAVAVGSTFRDEKVALLLLIPTSLPIFFLAGATWPREAMPSLIQLGGALIPATAISRLMLLADQMGAPTSSLRGPMIWVLALVGFYLTVACLVGRTNLGQTTRKGEAI